MFFYQYRGNQQKTPVRVKIILFAGVIFALAFFAIFAFTFFLFTLASGLVLFVLGLFRNPSTGIDSKSHNSVRHYRPPIGDDDTIDI